MFLSLFVNNVKINSILKYHLCTILTSGTLIYIFSINIVDLFQAITKTHKRMLFTAPTSTISNTRLLGTGSRKWRHANILFQRNYTYGWLMLQLITLQKLWWHVVLWMENPSITKTKIYKIYSFLVRTNCTKLMIKLAIDNNTRNQTYHHYYFPMK